MLDHSREPRGSLPTGLRPIGEIIPHTAIGRIIDTEWRLIAALLIDPERRRDVDLDAGAFADPLAGAVVTTMLDLAAEGKGIDIRTISHRLDAAGHDSRLYRRHLARVLAEDVPAHLAADYWRAIRGEVGHD